MERINGGSEALLNRVKIFPPKENEGKTHFCEEACCAVRESDMVFTSGGAGGDADRAQPLGLGILLV